LAARLADVKRAIRKLEAVAAAIVASADRRELFRDDGHASVRGGVKASIRVSDHTVTHRLRTARLCARQAALLQAALDSDGRCLWPGCGLHRCQVDHTPSAGPTGG
jgi:hypothetical protein